jgi:ankyrin repeat protein
MTPLMLAAWKGDPALIRDALKSGEKISAVDGSGWTALMVAAVLPRIKVVTAPS